jgi:hypothetical protein
MKKAKKREKMLTENNTANPIIEDMESYTATLYLCISKDKKLPTILVASGEVTINHGDKSIDVEAETQITGLNKEEAIKLLILKLTVLQSMIVEIEKTIDELTNEDV